MTDQKQDLADQFWEKLDDSPFVMLGLKGSGFSRPMTAQIDEDRTIYFFASREEQLVQQLAQSADAMATFASKGHDFFASIAGRLSFDNERQKIDRLWNPMISAWYDKGKDDPDLVLLRFDAAKADVWDATTGSGLKAAWVKLTGGDPGEQMKDDNRAEIAL